MPSCRKSAPSPTSWGDSSTWSVVEDYLIRAVEQTRLSYHIHSERIYLAGFCEGATVAYRLGMVFPERIAGIVSLNGAMPRQVQHPHGEIKRQNHRQYPRHAGKKGQR